MHMGKSFFRRTKAFFTWLCVILILENGFAYAAQGMAPDLKIVGHDGDRVILRVTGEPDVTYRVQASSDRENWTTLATSNSPSGTFDVVDEKATFFTRRFYQVSPEQTAPPVQPEQTLVIIEAADPDASELEGDTGRFLVSRTGDNTQPLSVACTVSGSAQIGNDYLALPAGITIPAGASEATLTVTPVPTKRAKPSKTVVLTLAPASGYLVGAPGSATVTIAGELSNNRPPSVSAGASQTLSTDQVATLRGVVRDDGLPNPPGATTAMWRELSGPGAVTFSDPNVPLTTARFAVAGAYVLQLIADDGELTSSDQVNITVAAGNQPPVADAGVDLTVTLPDNAVLHGSATDDGLPKPPGKLSTVWTKASGPGQVVFGNPSALVTSASFSQAGTYLLRLTANDGSLTNSSELTVTVNPLNQAPVVVAGPAQTISLPANAALSGMATDDGWPKPPGTLTTTWRKLSGPGTVSFANANAWTTSAAFSEPGTYVLRLTASDGSLSSSNDTQVTVNPANQAPVVNAGSDQTISLPANASLRGTATDDGWPNPPGALALTWSKVSGPGTVAFANANALSTTVTFSTAGTYVLRLSSEDGSLATTDDLQVVVNPAPNPASRFIKGINLNGPAVVIEGNQWLSHQDALAGGLQVGLTYSTDPAQLWTGNYTFTLTPAATGDTLSMLQTMAAAFQPPTGQGLALTQTLPTGNYQAYLYTIENFQDNSMLMEVHVQGDTVATGVGDLPLGTWAKYGPFDAVVGANQTLRIDVLRQDRGNVLMCGLAIFSSDPAPTNGAPNLAPAVNAGVDQTITLPASATLSGTAADDGQPVPPGALTVGWTKVSGPGTVTFASASVAATTASFSAAGAYVLRLTASDGSSSASDDVQVTVNPAPPVNRAPTVNAGADQTITLPASATLSGTATDDGLPNPPGTLTAGWTQVSGPGTVTFGNANALGTKASFSVEGTYVLRLSASDGSLSASDDVQVTVQAPPPAPVVGLVTLPIEVLGADGTIQEVTVNVASSALSSGPFKLWFQVHNLSYDNKGSVQINNSPWIDLNNSNPAIDIAQPGKAFHGIGGAYHTLKLTVAIPDGTVVAGLNTIRFRFNATDGVSVGYRVIKLNLLTAAGQNVLDSSAFVQDDPITWQGPYTTAAEIAAGQQIWTTAVLREPPIKGGAVIQAKCADCHTRDGRDLKYFNLSNQAIITRAQFWGLRQYDGELLASYIRSLPVPNPGRPWNPPYQPGPGLDAKPVSEWAAGAGVDWVLDTDSAMLAYLFPSGITFDRITNTAPNVFNTREQPITIQLPDWFHWLPRIHPLDGYGSSFENSAVWKDYQGTISNNGFAGVRGVFAYVKANNYQGIYPWLNYAVNAVWHVEWFNFLLTIRPTAVDAASGRKLTDYGNWHAVKMWELMQEYGMEGRQASATSREARTWYDYVAFDASPNILNSPYNATGINDNTPLMKRYFTVAWYQVQIALNPGNYSDGIFKTDIRPMDWPYCWGFFNEMTAEARVATSAMFIQNTVKAFQDQDFTTGKLSQGDGWSPQRNACLNHLVNPAIDNMWGPSDIPAAQRVQFYEGMTKYWIMKCKQFTPAQYYASGFGANSSWSTPRLADHTDGYFGYNTTTGLFDLPEQLWYGLPQLRAHGVSTATVNEIKAWAATIWPAANWASR